VFDRLVKLHQIATDHAHAWIGFELAKGVFCIKDHGIIHQDLGHIPRKQGSRQMRSHQRSSAGDKNSSTLDRNTHLSTP